MRKNIGTMFHGFSILLSRHIGSINSKKNTCHSTAANKGRPLLKLSNGIDNGIWRNMVMTMTSQMTSRMTKRPVEKYQRRSRLSGRAKPNGRYAGAWYSVY